MDELIEFQIILKNEFGEYLGKTAKTTIEEYKKVLEMTKSFYNSGGFELTCEDGTFVVFPPEIVRKSILLVKKINKDV